MVTWAYRYEEQAVHVSRDTHHQIGPDTGTTVSCHFVRGGEEKKKKALKKKD